ncbi:MAG: general secretion pathway protein E [Verrucomicrobiales bacterium]|jgi:general secretion pathway protein E
MIKVEIMVNQIAQRSGCQDLGALEALLQDCRGSGAPWVNAVLNAQLVDEEPFLRELGRVADMPWWEGGLESTRVDELRRVFPADLAIRYQVLPISLSDVEGAGQTLTLATCDPFDMTRQSVIARRVTHPVDWRMALRSTIMEGVRVLYGVGADTFEEIIQSRNDRFDDNLSSDEAMSLDVVPDEEASVLKFVNHVLRGALEQRATDIHLEPMDDRFRIRFRIDGALNEVPAPENMKAIQSSVISRLKIMAKLDIAERRLPQDGRIHLKLDGKSIDVRVATIPSVEGESVSLRLLGQQQFSLAKLGLNQSISAVVDKLLAMPNGIVLITGPTGSGKSTSLYCFLSEINTTDRRIVTIEDPVENKLRGVVQIAVKPDIELTFARGLRSILRGDPDVIMVGEMRDLETTEIAIRAALTGHLVFSTLHTNDAISGVSRLIDMGVEPFLVSSSVRAFIAQRLVRQLCEHCRTPREFDAAQSRQPGVPELAGRIYTAVGCNRCRGTGYHGRLALYEIARVTPAMEELINRSASRSEITAQAVRDGFVLMRSYGWEKVMQGKTTIEEVLSVTPAASS